MSRLAFWLLSDFHSELMEKEKVVRKLNVILSHISNNETYKNIKTKICLIAGDFGDPVEQSNEYKEYLCLVKEKFNYVYVITGNHEYYKRNSLSLEKVDEITRNICNSINNVKFLQRESSIIPDTNISIVGCTLWSLANREAFIQINDSKHVFDRLKDYNSIHIDHYLFIKQIIDDNELKCLKTILMTHHLPSFKLINNKYKCLNCKDNIDKECNHGMNSMFASKLDHLTKECLLAVCGHTHSKISYNNMLTNPYGYEHEKSEYSYEPILII